jgi:hypothetical protein
MPSSKLSRMLAVLRRYTSAPAKGRVPEEMVEELKAAIADVPRPLANPPASDEDRPTLH